MCEKIKLTSCCVKASKECPAGTISRNNVWFFSISGFSLGEDGSQKNKLVSLFPNSSSSKAETILNSPPLSVSNTGIISPKEKLLSFSFFFNPWIFCAASAAVLFSRSKAIIKSQLTKWTVIIVLPPTRPITVSNWANGKASLSSIKPIKSW